MTGLGGLGHTLPYLIKEFYLATWVSIAVVAVELAIISWIRHHFMDTPLLSAIFPGSFEWSPGLYNKVF
jgi:hypothetical protein